MALYVRVQRAKHLGKAKAHVNYIAFRSRENVGEERGAFGRSSDHADVAKFRENLGDHMTRHPMATKAYKLTISLSEKEFRELGLTGWKPMVREAIGNLEKEWGRQLQWMASEHMAKGHPHVHIVIKATAWHDTGRYGQLRLDKQHIQDIKKEFGRVIERHRERPKEQDRSMERSFGDTMLRAVEMALRALSRTDRDEDEHEMERAHQRWLRRQRSRDDDRGR
jgi:hypothetical protein